MDWRTLFQLISVAAGLALVQAPAIAQPQEIAELLALPTAGGLTGARDVPRFAWVERAAGVRNIWVADKGQAPRRLTAFTEDDGRLLYDLTFTPNGARLAYVIGGDDEYPDEEDLPNTASAAMAPKQQLFVMDVEGGAATLVGDGHSPAFSPEGDRMVFTRRGELWIWEEGAARKLAKVEGEISRLQWSPDASRLLFVDNRGDHAFVATFDLATGRLAYLDPGLGYSVEPVFSPGGRQAAFIRFVDPPPAAAADSGPYWSIRIADIAGSAARTLWTAPPGQGGRYAGTRSRNLFWSADGKIVFPWERDGWLHAYAIDAAKGGSPAELTPGAYEVETFMLGADNRSLIFAANAGDIDRRHLWKRPLSGGAPVQISQSEGSESLPALGGGVLAAIATDVSRPAYPVLVDRKLVPLGAVASARNFVAPEQVIFRAEDGVEVHGQLFRARGPGRHPALLFVHGGPRRQMLLGFHPSGYYSNAYILNQHLAAKGYDVLSVNYRSGTGYGLAYRDAPGTGRDGASEYRDVLAAGRWLAARGDVDPTRIGIWGGSWGGYLTALALARDSDLFAAGVDFHGVHSLLRSVPESMSPEAQTAARVLQWQASPIASLATWRSPVLLIHGDDDRNVAFSQSLLMARELSARHIPFRELVFPNERHSFFRNADWLASYRATEAFFDEKLKGKGAPR